MVVECPCGDFHNMTPTAMIVVIRSYQKGELQRVTKSGIYPTCMEEAFSNENVAFIQQRYEGRGIRFEKAGS